MQAAGAAEPPEPLAPLLTGARAQRVGLLRMQSAGAADAPGASEGAATAASDAGAARRKASNLRTLSIVLLIVQNTFITLLARETRIPVAGQAMYLGGAAVLASELIKLPVCLGMIARAHGGVRGMAREVWERVFVGWRDTLAMGVPAFLFCFQNLLFFVSVSNLSATSYQLWSQSKTLTTAVFFVLYCGGQLRRLQWVSLVLLCMGVGLVQLADGPAAVAASAAGNPVLGIGAVLLSSVLSGFANTYLEKKMKGSDASLWVRNVQLAIFGIPQVRPLNDLLSLVFLCARINHPFITHLHYPHYCNTIARRLRNIDPPVVCHTPCNIGTDNTV